MAAVDVLTAITMREWVAICLALSLAFGLHSLVIAVTSALVWGWRQHIYQALLALIGLGFSTFVLLAFAWNWW